MDNKEQTAKTPKKNRIIIIIAAVVIILGIIVFAAGSIMGVFGGISEQEARQAALDQVPGAQDENIVTLIKEFDDGRMEYEVKVVYDNVAYDFKILAKNGEIYSQEQTAIGGGQTQSSAASATPSDNKTAEDIGIEKAKEVAIAQVEGSTVGDVVKAEADMDGGMLTYEIEIIYNELQYDFEISASTGEVLKMESESIYD